MTNKQKVSRGQFFTTQDSWLSEPVLDFIQDNIDSVECFVDPFAGGGHMLSHISEKFNKPTLGYDIDSPHYQYNDSLESIPHVDSQFIITNPPYLAKHSAVRKGVYTENEKYFEQEYDLYMLAIRKCLGVCRFSVMVLPETFINSSFPKEQLDRIYIIQGSPFSDTDMPVCVCCFDSEKADGNTTAKIFLDKDTHISISDLDRDKYSPKKNIEITFNAPNGRIALKAVDGTGDGDECRFMPTRDFTYGSDKIKESSRLMTCIDIPSISDNDIDGVIEIANSMLGDIRDSTHGLLFSAFKGNNKIGKRRRRVDYSIARYILENCCAKFDNPSKIGTIS